MHAHHFLLVHDPSVHGRPPPLGRPTGVGEQVRGPWGRPGGVPWARAWGPSHPRVLRQYTDQFMSGARESPRREPRRPAWRLGGAMHPAPPTPSPSPGVPRVTCWRGATVSASQDPHHHHHHHPPPPGPAARWRTSSWPAEPPAPPSASPTPRPACPLLALARAGRRCLPHSRHVSHRAAGVWLRVSGRAPGWAGGAGGGWGAGV